MKKTLHMALATVAVAFAFIAAAEAHEYKQAGILIVHPYSRVSAGKTGAAYLSIENQGREADRLTGVASPAAEAAEIHEMKMDGAIMRMRQLPGIDLPAGGKTALEPGGNHIMLIGLKAPLKEGDKFPLTLTFAKAGKVEVEVIVQKLGAPAGHPHSP